MTVQPVDFTPPHHESAKLAKAKVKDVKPRSDSNKHTDKAKQLVVDNYNAHHDSTKTPPLTLELVFVTSFTMVGTNWKAVVESSVVRGLQYVVTYNSEKSEATVDVFKKINQLRIAD